MADKPNILFLLNDHQLYYGHGEMAGGPKIQRPNFEKLANQGIEFTRAYTACPLCGPARRTMLTGLFPHNHLEILNEVDHPFDKETYLELLAKIGYENYYYGKWHAGSGTAHDLYCQGFNYPKFGNPYITPEYKEYLKQKNLSPFQVKITHSFWAPEWKRTKEAGLTVGETYSPCQDNYDESALGVMTTPLETHEAIFLAHLACEQLKQIAASGNKKSFHMRVDFWGPHAPYFVSEEFLNLYNPKDIPMYPNFNDDLKGKPTTYIHDMYHPISNNGKLIVPNPMKWSEWQDILARAYAHISLIDHAGGLILNTLEDLGLAENTMVIWTTDHGDGLSCHGGHFDKDDYLPEELLRIPLVIRYPEKITAGQICKKFVSNIDLAPTILDIAGTAFSAKVDGESLVPLLININSQWRDDLMIETHGHKHLHLGRVLVWDRYKFVSNEKDKDELYDLVSDPYELNNLVDDKVHASLIEEMKSKLGAWRENTNDQMTKTKIRKFVLQGKI